MKVKAAVLWTRALFWMVWVRTGRFLATPHHRIIVHKYVRLDYLSLGRSVYLYSPQ